jgi:hypothetical protein
LSAKRKRLAKRPKGPTLQKEERTITVTVEGLEPGLLMNSPKSMMLEKKTKKRGEIPSREEDAEIRTYRMKTGELYIPNTWFKGTLLNSAAAYKIGKKSAVPYVAGTVKVWPPMIPLGTDEFEIDTRPVVVQRSRIVRARPHLAEWSATFTLIYNPTYNINPEWLRQVLKEAGERVGIGDFRPQHRGDFGRFVITGWQPHKK